VEAVGGAGVEEVGDFRAQERGEFFIGVEGEDPRLGAVGEGGIFLIAVPEPVLVDDGGPGGGGELAGGVGAAAVEDDDFSGQAGDRGQAAWQIVFLVAGDDGNGQGRHHGSLVMVMGALAKPKLKKPRPSFDKAWWRLPSERAIPANRMAFRIEKAVVRGELSNEERGVVTGRIWLAGRKEPLVLSLRGDCLRDLAGSTVRFTNPRPAADASLAVLALEQRGVAGELTGSRKVKQPMISELEVLELMEKERSIPCRMANCLYLEWYSEENGRVVIDTADYTVGVTVPVWTMTEAEEEVQLGASQREFHRFINTITGETDEAGLGEGGRVDEGVAVAGLEEGGEEASVLGEGPAGGEGEEGEEGADFFEDVPLNEFEWEQELRDADRRAEAYQEAFEKYRDHPERERMIAAALGWQDDDDDEEDDEDEDESEEDFGGDPPLGARLMGESLSGHEGEEGVLSWSPGLDEGGELGEENPFGSHHPLSQRAMDFALALQREAEERGLMADTPESRDHSPVLSLILHIITLGGKLAGALDGWAQGLDPEPGFIIAMLKRAQVPLNEALHAFDCIDAASLTAETRQWLQTRKRDLFELRREIIDLMQQLRRS